MQLIDKILPSEANNKYLGNRIALFGLIFTTCLMTWRSCVHLLYQDAGLNSIGVGMSNKLDAYPAQLSGGQQQRISIARALALKPQLIMFDEPTSALDPELTHEVLSVMSGLAKDGMTLLVVTHEMGFARSVADRIIFLEQGSILEEGPPEKMFTAPENERTRSFLQKISQLD